MSKHIRFPVFGHEDARGEAAPFERGFERLARQRGVGDCVHVARDDRGIWRGVADALDVCILLSFQYSLKDQHLLIIRKELVFLNQ